jgi:hypothetical protein
LVVKDSYAAGKVTGRSGTTGGLIGAQAPNGVTLAVSASFWDTSTSEQQNSLGEGSQAAVGLPTDEMQTLSTFSDAGWEIIDNWDDDQGTPDWGLRRTVNGGYPFLLWEYDYREPWFCGVLDEEGFYQVSNADELANVGAGSQHGPCGLGDKYRQVQNIDLGDWGSWEPIGANSFDFDFGLFSGHYNGGGFRIDDMSIESEWTLVDEDDRMAGLAAGLFLTLDGATISNLTIAGAQITVSDDEPTLDPNLVDAGVEARKAVPVAGILAGYSLGSTIDNVEVSGTLEELDTVAGGLIGAVASFGQESTTMISNCSVDVTMTTVDDAETTLGGIVGAITTGAHVEISACDDVKVGMTVNLAGTSQFQNIFEVVRFEFPGPQPTGDNEDIGAEEAAIFDVIGELVGIVGGVVGGIDLTSSLTLRDISLSAESSIIVTGEEPTDPDPSSPPGAPLALGGLLGFAAGAVEITDSTVGSTSAQGSQFDADPALLVVRGDIPFGGIGGLAGMTFIPMNFGQLEITSSSAATQMDIEVDFFEMGV